MLSAKAFANGESLGRHPSPLAKFIDGGGVRSENLPSPPESNYFGQEDTSRPPGSTAKALKYSGIRTLVAGDAAWISAANARTFLYAASHASEPHESPCVGKTGGGFPSAR